MDYYLIEVMAPGATTYNFTVSAYSRDNAIAVARNLGATQILQARLFDAPYRHNEPVKRA